ncbi:MAG: hypothetical protein R2711_02060 [Acidimicrobiales bacterium]
MPVDGIGLAAATGAVVVLVAAGIAWFLLPSSHVLPASGAPGAVDPTDPHLANAAGDVVDEGALEPSPVID